MAANKITDNILLNAVKPIGINTFLFTCIIYFIIRGLGVVI